MTSPAQPGPTARAGPPARRSPQARSRPARSSGPALTVRSASARLSQQHQRDVATVAGAATSLVVSAALGADPAAVSTWFFGVVDGLIARIQVGYAQNRNSAMTYLTRHAALNNASVVPVVGSLDVGALRRRLEIVGPVGFKSAIAAGQDTDEAIRHMATNMGGVADEVVRNGDRDVITETARRGRGVVGWRRRLSGRSCGFCSMLASRGAVYVDRRTATISRHGGAYHPHCHCWAEPLYQRGDEPPEVRLLQRQWSRVTAGHSGRDAMNVWRQHWEQRATPAAQARFSIPAPRPGAPAPVRVVGIRAPLANAPSPQAVAAVFRQEWRRITGRNIDVQFTGSVATAREHAEGLLMAAERFPQVRLERVALGPWGATNPMYARTLGAEISFSDRWTTVANRQRYMDGLAKDAAARWHPAGTGNPAAIAIHEFGHILDLETLGRAAHADIDAILRRHVRAGGLHGVDELVEAGVSKYAGRNIDEMVAEAFTDVMMNGPAASRLSQEIFAVLEAEYRRGVGRTAARGLRFSSPDVARMPVTQLRQAVTGHGITVPTGLRTPELRQMVDDLQRGVPPATARETAVRAILTEREGIAAALSEVAEMAAAAPSARAMGFLAGQLRRRLTPDQAKTARALLDALDAGDVDAVRAAIPAVARSAKLKPVGAAGDVVPVDATRMTRIDPSGAAVSAEVKSGRAALDAGQIDASGVRRPPSITTAEWEALETYTSDAQRINALIREGRTGSRAIAGLDSVLRRSELDTDIEVWRGLQTGRGVFGARLSDDLTGTEWVEQAYVSTSASRAVAEQFGGSFGTQPVVMRIHAPGGTRAVTLSEWGESALGSQAEVLIARGTRFRVVRDHGVQPHPMIPAGMRVIDVEIVPDVPRQSVVRVVRPGWETTFERSTTLLVRADVVGATPQQVAQLPVKAAKKAAPRGTGVRLLDEPETGLTAAERDRVRRLVKDDPQIYATVQDRFGLISTSGNLSDADAAWLQSIYVRERAFVERVAQDASIRRGISEAARKAGQTVPEYRATVTRKLQELLAEKPIAVRVRDEDALRAILSGGRFKTSPEGVRRAAGLSADPARRRLGEEVMGVPTGVPIAERPVYGYVAINDIEAALAAGRKIPGIRELEGQEDILSAYGRVQVVLKQDVRARTTATVGDSLDEIGFLRPSAVDSPTIESIGFRKLQDVTQPGWSRRGYVEAQIHGGVRTDDIAAVIFSEAPNPATVAALTQRGIPWRVLSKGDSPLRLSDIAGPARVTKATKAAPVKKATAPKAPPAPERMSIPALKTELQKVIDGAPLRLDLTGVPKPTLVQWATRARTLPPGQLGEEVGRWRQVVIDRRRALAEALAEADELVANGASQAALSARAAARLRRVEQALADWPELVELRKLVTAMSTGDPAKIRRAITAAQRKLGLTRIGEQAGTVGRFDQATMTPISGARIADDAAVIVVRPGYEVTVSGERIVLSRPVVEEFTPPTRRTARELLSDATTTDQVDETLRAVFEGQFGRFTTRITTHRRIGHAKRRDAIGIEGKIFDSRGLEVGRFSRVVEVDDKGDIWVHNALLEFDSARMQGTGFAREFNDRAMEWYRQAGVKGVYLDAVDIGKYAWATQGFDFSGPVPWIWDNLRDLIDAIRAGKKVTAGGHRLSASLLRSPDLSAQLAAAEDILRRVSLYRFGDPRYPTARELSQLGRWSGAGKADRWLGKELMLNSAWSGVMLL